MNLIIIDLNDVKDDLTVELSSRQSKHCVAVLEVEVGSKLNVGVKNSGKGTATVISIYETKNKNKKKFDRKGQVNGFQDFEHLGIEENNLNIKCNPKIIPNRRKLISEINNINDSEYSVTIKLDTPFHTFPCEEEYPLIDLIVALPRPKVFEKVLGYAVTIGVGRIIFVCANKSEKSYLNSSKMKKEAINQIVQIGLEQACSTLHPDVYIYASWKLFLQHLRDFFFNKKDMIGIVADIKGNKISEVGLNKHLGSVILAFGPEGGWSDQELKDFIKEGFHVVNIGSRTLKVETAVISLCSKTELLLTDREIRKEAEVAKRDSYWLSSSTSPGIVVLPIRGRKWENKHFYTQCPELKI